MAGQIHIAAAALMRADGQTLLVRKRGTRAFMQPGGKLDADERARQALVRELAEELGIAVDPDAAVSLGRIEAPAANEPGFTVVADLFLLRWEAPVRPAAEIEEIRWIDPSAPGDLPLAPLTQDLVLPMILARA